MDRGTRLTDSLYLFASKEVGKLPVRHKMSYHNLSNTLVTLHNKAKDTSVA